MELHKRRRALTEPEVRYFVRQVLLAVSYLHREKVSVHVYVCVGVCGSAHVCLCKPMGGGGGVIIVLHLFMFRAIWEFLCNS